MEILYPDEPRYPELKAAYFNKDLGSIFGLLKTYYGQDITKLEELMRDGNVYELILLLRDGWTPTFTPSLTSHSKPDDLNRFINHDDDWAMYRILNDIQTTPFIDTLKSLYNDNITIDGDSISQGQLHSKMWLMNELKHLDIELGTVFLCAGWYGILSMLMFEHGLKIDKVRSFDIDPNVESIADKFNKPQLENNWQFKAVTEDIHNINFAEHRWQAWSNTNERLCSPITDKPDTIINTSCEHIENFGEWYGKIPAGKIVILQSNNFQDVDEHINISKTLHDFAMLTPMSVVLYSGELPLPKYTRFMRIGIK